MVYLPEVVIIAEVWRPKRPLQIFMALNLIPKLSTRHIENALKRCVEIAAAIRWKQSLFTGTQRKARVPVKYQELLLIVYRMAKKMP